MEVIKLPPGEHVAECDCIRIQEAPAGSFNLTGSVLFRCGDAEVAESVSLIGGEPYASYDAAEAAGLAWASEHCPEIVYVCQSDGTQPLPDVADS